MAPELPIDDAERVPLEIDEEALFAEIAGTAEARGGKAEPTRDPIGAGALQTAASELIKIDECDRLVSATDREGLALRAAAVVSAVIAAFGLAWIVAGTLISGRVSGSHELTARSADPPSSDTSSSKGDRLQTIPIAAGAKSKTGDPGSAERQERQKLSPPPSTARKRSVAAVPASAPAPSRPSPVAPQQMAPAEMRAEESELPKLVPVPETKPTTIEGWTVRDVAGSTAVIEGPNGVFRVAAGNTVPALGRIESIVRWGNRWIVATTSGLVSTP